MRQRGSSSQEANVVLSLKLPFCAASISLLPHIYKHQRLNGSATFPYLSSKNKNSHKLTIDLSFVGYFERGSHYVVQATLKLTISLTQPQS